jgi:hypothetical protein
MEGSMQSPQPPPAAVMMQMLLGRFVSQAIGAAAKLKLADHLASGAKSAAEIAPQCGARADTLHRLLRALASLGIFAEQDAGRFVNTPLSETLRDVPGSVRPMALFFNHASHLKAWAELDFSVRTGESGFIAAHGMPPWEYLNTPAGADAGAVFNDAMTALSAQFAPAAAQAYDFSEIGTLVDVGGGHGLLLRTILAKHPSMRGVLFDLPQVVEGANAPMQASGLSDRVTIVGGSFFEEVPAGDAYIMKHIIHDWSDDKAIHIFKTIAKQAKPGTKLLLVEGVIKPGNDPDMGKIIDLEMLVVTEGGRERTEDEYRAILKSGGFTLRRVLPTMSPMSVIEATRD